MTNGSYVQDLSPKKQDKALIHSKRAANIKAVLIDKKTTAVESAQFRYDFLFSFHPARCIKFLLCTVGCNSTDVNF